MKSSDSEVEESQLRLIKPLKRVATTTTAAAAAAASPMSGEYLDLEESHDDPQGDNNILCMGNNFKQWSTHRGW